MNIEKAKKLLKERSWVSSIEKIPNVRPKGKRWRLRHADGDYFNEDYSDRELCSMAIGEINHGRSWKKTVKHFGKRKNRAATRDALKAERYDKIPQKGRVKDEDPWAWD